MKLRHRINGGLAEVGDDYGMELIAGGSWESADAPAAPKAPRHRKAAQRPVEAPETE